jgi:hypothetical protein
MKCLNHYQNTQKNNQNIDKTFEIFIKSRGSRIPVPVRFRESGTGTGISAGNGNIPGNFRQTKSFKNGTETACFAFKGHN